MWWRVTHRKLEWTVCILAIAAALTFACRRPHRTAAPGPASKVPIAELWVDPGRGRDLYWGVGGKRLAPDPAAIYKVIDIKKEGFSRGYEVKGPDDREWSTKFPPEAQTEVVASRILWGVGYHQPPIYLVARWNAENAPDAYPNPQSPARFREKRPNLNGLDTDRTWSYFENPFVGTVELNGLIVLQAMLGNSDLKDENNALYELKRPLDGARRWYVARDVGQSFGRTGVMSAPRGDIEVFEETPFIKGVVDGKVKFDWRGRHDALLEDIKPSDVRWICARLQRLTDTQLHDAFRAGGYSRPTATRFIRRLEQKIAEGLALKD